MNATYTPEAAAYYKMNLIKAFIQVMGNLEGQDTVLTLDAVEAMIVNVQGAELIDIDYYVRHYCDVIDGAEDAERFTLEIMTNAQDMPNPLA